jgi:hypothetical protein
MLDYYLLVAVFITISGYVVGLGAVTVIDLHGFLAQKSPYWTKATISAHKVTKPLIWLGTTLAVSGSLFTHFLNSTLLTLIHTTLFIPLVLNGLFLSFIISPYLIRKEREGKSEEILNSKIQLKIKISFIVSITCWWLSLVLYLYNILNLL